VAVCKHHKDGQQGYEIAPPFPPTPKKVVLSTGNVECGSMLISPNPIKERKIESELLKSCILINFRVRGAR
jgi:hypothetical protein